LESSKIRSGLHLSNLPRLLRLPSLDNMPLRCLLFSSDEAMTAPIRQVLSELGVEAEYCQNPVDAVERVTTQLFQIVITDWQDQPEAAFLLKTARDLKAAARPLTLAIVNEENRPHALQAGANSVLLKPIRPEQVRDTMSTACELLRSKLQTAAPTSTRTPLQPGTVPGKITAAGPSAAAPAPAFTAQAPEKLRAGEFLQPMASRPGAQFDTESEAREAIETSSRPVDSLTELEPMAAAVQEIPEAKLERQEALTGWAALQARLTKSAPAAGPPIPREAATQNEFLSYEAATSFAPPSAASQEPKFPTPAEQQPASERAVAPASQVSVRDAASDPAPEPVVPRAKRGKIYVLALALVSVALVAVPRTRERLREISRTGARAALRWLNPPPAPLPQTVPQHDSFGQPDDEYKLPATGNIPDSTTDPSKIEVVPVVDPTAKPDKSAASSGTSAQAATGAQPPSEQPPANGGNAAADQKSAASPPAPQIPAVAAPSFAAPINPAAAPSGNGPGNPAPAASANVTTVAPPQSVPVQSVSSPQPAPVAQHQVQPAASAPMRNSSPPHAVSASEMAGIPSSLKSQIASTAPEMSGAKPDDAVGSSLEPVSLPESAIRSLLAQAPNPEYPAAAKASGQQGSVVLQVLIGPDGAVQDAKFMQGSFVFARAAIDAVKQWRFKPYSMNGRAVSVQSVITLSFKP
jgi:periplasmic protein TonB